MTNTLCLHNSYTSSPQTLHCCNKPPSRLTSGASWPPNLLGGGLLVAVCMVSECWAPAAALPGTETPPVPDSAAAGAPKRAMPAAMPGRGGDDQAGTHVCTAPGFLRKQQLYFCLNRGKQRWGLLEETKSSARVSHLVPQGEDSLLLLAFWAINAHQPRPCCCSRGCLSREPCLALPVSCCPLKYFPGSWDAALAGARPELLTADNQGC